MEIKKYRKGEVIFREGDPGDCMYDVIAGRIGVYSAYGTPNQKLLMTYYPDQFLGEMGLLNHAPRSATAVALESDTAADVISEESFQEFFEKRPVRVLMIMQQMSYNLRRRTNDYVEVCRKIHEFTEKEGA